MIAFLEDTIEDFYRLNFQLASTPWVVVGGAGMREVQAPFLADIGQS